MRYEDSQAVFLDHLDQKKKKKSQWFSGLYFNVGLLP